MPRISELPASSPLVGDEAVPVVQAGETRQAPLNQLRGGQELAYAEIQANFLHSGNVYANVPGLSITIEADGTTPIILESWIYALQHNTAPAWAQASIREGETELSTSIYIVAVNNDFSTAILLRRRLVPTAGTHTYNISIRTPSGGGTGSAQLYANNIAPAYITAHTVDTA